MGASQNEPRDYPEHALIEAVCKAYGYKLHEVYDLLTWPQIHLLIDGAAENAPKYDDPGKKNIPPRPDLKENPIERLRWDFLHSPSVPAMMRKSPEEVEQLCQRFDADIKAGRKIWDEQVKQWVSPNNG